MPENIRLERWEQEELFYKLFPHFRDDYDKWQDFQLLVYNIIERWKKIPLEKMEKKISSIYIHGESTFDLSLRMSTFFSFFKDKSEIIHISEILIEKIADKGDIIGMEREPLKKDSYKYGVIIVYEGECIAFKDKEKEEK